MLCCLALPKKLFWFLYFNFNFFFFWSVFDLFLLDKINEKNIGYDDKYIWLWILDIYQATKKRKKKKRERPLLLDSKKALKNKSELRSLHETKVFLENGKTSQDLSVVQFGWEDGWFASKHWCFGNFASDKKLTKHQCFWTQLSKLFDLEMVLQFYMLNQRVESDMHESSFVKGGFCFVPL